MDDSASKLLTGINIILFITLTFIGVLFLMSASYDPSVAAIRLVTGLGFIIIAIAILVIVSLLIQRGKVKVVKITKGSQDIEKHIPSEIICNNCKNSVLITENLKTKDSVICETCGKEIRIPKSKVNW